MIDDPKNDAEGDDTESEDVEIPDFDDVHEFEFPPKNDEEDG